MVFAMHPAYSDIKAAGPLSIAFVKPVGNIRLSVGEKRIEVQIIGFLVELL
jgi:hypothetical protein